MLSKIVDGRPKYNLASQVPYLLEQDDKACIVWADQWEEEVEEEEGETQWEFDDEWLQLYYDNIEENRRRTMNIHWITQLIQDLKGHTGRLAGHDVVDVSQVP